MADLEPGAVLGGRFEIAGVLGRGGMATVYLARDRVRDERVALKVLHPHLADQPASRDRLRRELAAAQRIHHPRALVVRELFELDGLLALSMPLHPGQTLAEDLESAGPMDEAQLWRLGEALAGALAEAHRAGVVHRDVAPGNVLMDAQREGTLTDFGLARLDEARTRTATTAIGTAGFTAPEVLDGGRATPRSDLYGLGCVLYMAASGEAPFAAPSAMATLKRQIEGGFEPLARRRPELPAALRDQIEGLLQRDPERRPESARAVAEAMSRKEAPQTRSFSETRSSSATESSESPGPLLPAPRLPAGSATVLLREPVERAHRRRNRRRHLRRARRAGLEGLIEGLAAKAEPAFREWLGLPAGREPEELLRDAVAEEAGLPGEALRLVPVLEEGRFRLVEGVAGEVAERLAEQARVAGYSARVVPDHLASGHRILPAPLAVLGTLLGPLIVGAAVLGLNPATPPQMVAMALAVVLGLSMLISSALLGVLRVRPAPLAYGADLSRYLTETYARRLAPAARSTTAAAAATPATPATPAAAPKPGSERPDPHASLVARVGERLASLEQAIAESAARLPPPAVLDLGETLAELRARSLAIERHLSAITTSLAGRDAQAEEQAVARVQARLERLRARARSGEPADPNEQSGLERALRSHQEQLAAAEEDEQRITRLQASLLEISAAAERTRRALLDEADPARSVEDLLGRLRAEGASARAAEDEVVDARRRAAARQAQRGG